MRGKKTALILLLALAFFTRFACVARDSEELLAAPITDDGFYNLTLARNVARGAGFTFDGSVKTSGFHPAVVVISAPAFLVFGDDTASALRCILFIYAVAGTILGWMIYRIVYRLAGPGPGLAALMLYATSPDPAALGQTMNGCDTVFALLALAVTTEYYLARVRSAAAPPSRRLLMLGLLTGGMCVVRLDLALFAAFLVLDLVLVWWRRRVFSIRGLVLLMAGGVATILPWIMLICALSGRPVPDNARAVRLLSRVSAGLEVNLGKQGLFRSLGGSGTDFAEGAPVYSDDEPPAIFYTTMLQHAGCELLKIVPHTGLGFNGVRLAFLAGGLNGSGRWESVRRALADSGAACIFPLVLAVLFLILLLCRFRRLKDLPGLRRILFLLPAALSLYLAYALVIFGQWSFDRYLFPVSLVALLFTPAFAVLVTRTWTVLKTGMFTAVCLIFFLAGSKDFLLVPRPSSACLQAKRVAAYMPQDAVIGAIQAGHFSFFCPQQVVNLDGKVDAEAYRALAERRVLRYARKRGVRFISDWPFVLKVFLFDRSDPALCACMIRLEPPPDSKVLFNQHGFATYGFEPGSP